VRRSGYVVVAAVGIAVGVAEYALHYRGLVFPDALDYAQMARETAAGRFLRTLIVRPHTVAWGQAEPFRDLSRPPLHPLVLGGWFALAGPGELQAAVFSALFWLASGVALFALGRSRTASPAALAAGGLFFLSPRLLPYAWSGMSEPAFILLLVLGFDMLSKPRQTASGSLAGSLLIATACLWRAVGVLAIPWAILVGWRGHGHSRRGRVLLVGGLTAPLLGWVLVRRLSGASGPLSFNLAQLPMFTEAYPRYSLFRGSVTVDPVGFLLSNPAAVAAKFWFGLKVYLKGMLVLLPVPATVAWVLGVAVPRYNRKLLPLRNATVGLVATYLCILPLYEPTPRFLLPLIPLLLLLGSAQVWAISPRRARIPVLVVWTAVCVIDLHTWVRAPVSPPERFPPTERRTLTSLIGPSAVVLTDAPWRTAWELGVKSVWIPQDEETLRFVERKVPGVEAFILTPALPAMDPSERPPFWMGVWQGRIWPSGYARLTTKVRPSAIVGIRSPADAAQ
jgi:hypothetical protein